MLRHCQLRGRHGQQVSAAALKLVLLAIDDHAGQHGWCFATQETLASETHLSVRTIQRAVAVLHDDLGVVIVEQRGNSAGGCFNHCRIVWSELALLCRARKESDGSFQRAASVTTQSASVTTQSASSGGLIYKRPRSAHEAPPPNPQVSNNVTRCRTPETGTNEAAASGQPHSVDGRPPESGHGTWQAAAECLVRCGVRFATAAVRDAKQAGLTVADVLSLCETYQRHKGRLEGPGALLFRIRAGDWPAELPTDEQTQHAESWRTQTRDRRELSSVIFQLRQRRIPESKIRAFVRDKFDTELCIAEGY